MLIISSIISGLSLGSMYGLIALGFHVTYVVSNTVNFSQGSAVMIGAVLGYTFAVTLGWPLPLAVLLSLLLCGLFGLLVERTLVRPFAERKSNAWLMATVAGGILVDNIVLFTFGKEPRSFPSLLAEKPIQIFGAGVYPQELLIPAFALLVMFGFLWMQRRTLIGRAMQAVSFDRNAAALMGINLSRVTAMSFAGGAGAAGLAGLLVSPNISAHYLMGVPLAIQGFTALVIGGVGRVEGALLGGLLLAFAEQFVARYAPIPSGYTQGVPLLFLMIFLLVRPTGLLRARA